MKIKHLLYAIAGALSVALLIALLPVDSDLDTEAAAWGEAANDTAETSNNGYYYLMGIMAAPGEDPAAAGKALLDAYLSAEREFLEGKTEEFTAPEYPPEKMLSRIAGDYYCMLQEHGCIAQLTGDPVALRLELATHAELLRRYGRLLEFAELKPVTQPTFYESLPPWRYLIDGHRVNQLSIILEHLSGRHAAAMEMLRQDMERLRGHLAAAHSLIGKMVMLSMYANDLDLLFNIAAPEDARQPIPPLAAAERSLQAPLMREFGNIVNFHRHFETHPASFSSADGAYGWLLRATVRPNRSVNGMFPYFREIAGLSAQDAAAFNTRAAAGALPVFESRFDLRNAGGSYLNSMAAPMLVPYIARMHDVDCKIALVNAALPLDKAAWQKTLEEAHEFPVANPYRPEEKAWVDREAGALCFSGPLPDEQRHRCIRRTGTGST